MAKRAYCRFIRVSDINEWKSVISFDCHCVGSTHDIALIYAKEQY